MHAAALSIAGVLLFGAFALGAGGCVGLWLAIRSMRPELLEDE